MADAPVPALTAAIGLRLRELRLGEGLSQDDIAAAARRCGLRWKRSSVAALEAGNRDLSVGEFLSIPEVLYFGTNFKAHVTLNDLLPEEGEFTLNGAVFDVRNLRAMLAGDAFHKFVYLSGSLHAFISLSEPMPVLSPDPQGEVEQNASRKLGISGEELHRTALRLWRRSLTAEREVRVGNLVTGETSRRSRQAIRGHVMRALLAELELEVRKPSGRKRRPTAALVKDAAGDPVTLVIQRKPK